MHVPIDVLARLGGDEFAWQVPALREELVTALIRSLPKDLRRNFVPAPDTARAVLAAIDPAREPLLDALQRELRRRTGVLVPIDAFDLDKLPAHLRVTFAVESADGTEIAREQGPRRRCRSGWRHPHGARSPTLSPPSWNGPGCAPGPTTCGNCRESSSARLTDAPCGASLPSSTRAPPSTCGCSPRPVEQEGAMGPGTRRLVRLSVASPVKAVERQLDPRTRLALGANPDGSLSALLDDCADAAADALVPAPVWTAYRVRRAA